MSARLLHRQTQPRALASTPAWKRVVALSRVIKAAVRRVAVRVLRPNWRAML